MLWAALSATLSGSAVGASVAKSGSTIQLESDGGAVLDLRTNLLVLPKVRISQDGYLIKADEARATGLNFENSRWTFTGQVEITTPEGDSKADTATVSFLGNEISTAEIVGAPATFAQRDPQNQQVAQGKAGRIDYDMSKNTVRFTQNAWISYGQNELTGESIVYDMVRQTVAADRGEKQDERVRITINPAEAKQLPSPHKPNAH